MSTRSKLTTTSYAILGLLAVRPFTTYELAQQMDRALGQFWPRARSMLYAEPKNLVAHGLATAEPETVGKRRRTRYSITDEGRQALAGWMATDPATGPALEFEHLVKIFFAEHGSKARLLELLDGARAWSEEQTVATGHVAREYADGLGPFPERLPWLVLVGQFLDDFLVLVEEWATWATSVVESWPDDLSAAEPDQEPLVRQARRADEVRRRRAAGDDA